MPPPYLVGCSEWAASTRSQIAQIATHPATVLITGPSGTGKELVAHSIHSESSRAGELPTRISTQDAAGAA